MLQTTGIAAVLMLAVLAALPAIAQTGPAHVIDGDTIDVAGTRVRLWGDRRPGVEADVRATRCHLCLWARSDSPPARIGGGRRNGMRAQGEGSLWPHGRHLLGWLRRCGRGYGA